MLASTNECAKCPVGKFSGFKNFGACDSCQRRIATGKCITAAFVVPFASIVLAPKEVLVAGSKSRIAFEAAFVKSVIARAKAALKVDVAASAVKITSVTAGDSRRRMLAVSVKVAYTVAVPAAAASAALVNKAAVQRAVAATATSTVAADASIQTAVAVDKKAASAKVSTAASSARAAGLSAALALTGGGRDARDGRLLN